MIKITQLNKDEALRYMGHKGEVPDTLMQIVSECEKKLLEVLHPTFYYQCFDIQSCPEGIKVLGTSLIFKGNDIKTHLEGCSKAVLMCATIGSDVDRLIRLTQVTDISSAFAMDALASTAIEQVGTKADKIIRDSFPDYYMTWRYSPGYGDFPIEIQREFLDVLNAQKRIGLCTGSSDMLTPVKSITAIAGLSQTPIAKTRRGCACCNMAESCQYRKRGDHCGF